MIEGGYTTSSNIVNEIIEKDGIDSFIIRRIRVFTTAEQVVDYETRFLRRVNARKNQLFYNSHNNDGYFDREKAKQRMLHKYGVDNFAKSDEFAIRFRETSRKKYGVDHHLQNPDIKAKQIRTNVEKYGVGNPLENPDIRKKVKETKKGKIWRSRLRKSPKSLADKSRKIWIRKTNTDTCDP
jgi:hypothetical protein